MEVFTNRSRLGVMTVGFVLLVVLCWFGWRFVRILIVHSSCEVVSGVVVAEFPERRNLKIYEYTVNGVLYLGSGLGGFYSVGDKLDVYYSTYFPSISLIHFRNPWSLNSLFPLLVVLGFCVVTLSMYFIIRKSSTDL